MARQRLLECSFLIPIRRDRNLADGKPHKHGAWDWLDGQLVQFGGGSLALELYEGGYVDPDTHERITDRSKKYTIALPRKELSRLRAVLREACQVFAQKSIYLSVAGHVEFVEGTGS
jgi:hypothetical protein